LAPEVALRQLAEADALDDRMLRLVTDDSAVLAGINVEAAEVTAPEQGAWAMLLDGDATIMLAVFSADRQAACATLIPVAAIRLGGQLVAAGVRRL
jgi:hypothetical protein